MKFRDLPLRDVEAFFERVLGPAPNMSERSRRVIASIQLDAGKSPTGLEKKEEQLVRKAMEDAP